MFNHEPPGYQCPFCAVLQGGETTRPGQDDIVARRERATALIASSWWPRNPGHVLVVPNADRLRTWLAGRADDVG